VFICVSLLDYMTAHPIYIHKWQANNALRGDAFLLFLISNARGNLNAIYETH